MRPAAIVLLVLLAGCASLESQLDEAAQKKGKADAGLTLPPWPDDCRKKEPHAPLVEGAEAISLLKRERLALNLQNRRTDRCSDLYDSVVEKLTEQPT